MVRIGFVAVLAGGMALAGAMPSSAQTGTIRGVVTTDARTPPPIRVSFDQRVCGNELPDQSVLKATDGGLANAVVSVTGVKAKSAPEEAVVLNQKCAFVPRVQIVAPNGRVKTSSTDPMLHTTVVSQADGRQLFNVALPAPGIELTKSIGSAEVLRVGCSTHQWMRGWLVVTDEASAVTGRDGGFTISGVPPGTYELRTWHESLHAATQKVTVQAGKTTDVRIQAK
ncbi:MAG: carboxypeptidase regulatory-like domain-containing protein [Vicinamibacterales bacterium]